MLKVPRGETETLVSAADLLLCYDAFRASHPDTLAPAYKTACTLSKALQTHAWELFDTKKDGGAITLRRMDRQEGRIRGMLFDWDRLLPYIAPASTTLSTTTDTLAENSGIVTAPEASAALSGSVVAACIAGWGSELQVDFSDEFLEEDRVETDLIRGDDLREVASPNRQWYREEVGLDARDYKAILRREWCVYCWPELEVHVACTKCAYFASVCATTRISMRLPSKQS